MKRSRFSEEQIIGFIRQAEARKPSGRFVRYFDDQRRVKRAVFKLNLVTGPHK